MKLARHTLFNLVGLGAPLLVAVVSIPILIDILGPARFGLLTLIWAVVSYFGLFDLGLGRALTQRLASTLALKNLSDVGPIVATAGFLMTGIGLLAGVVMALLAHWGVALVSGVPDPAEAVRAVLVMATAVPAVVLTSGLRGVLEAQHAFGLVNLLRLPLGLFTFLGPVAVALWFGPRLDVIALVLAVGRLVALAAHAWVAWSTRPAGCGRFHVQRDQMRPLLATGGWLTLSNLVGPVMGYADRFVIAATVSASAVAYYATPNELVTKLWIIPGALTAVLFPAFAAGASTGDRSTWPLAMRAVRWLFVTLLPLTLALAFFAGEILGAWINPAFAVQSAPILRLFAIGIFVNCLAHVPLTLLQGAGQARAPSLLQAAQLLPYVALMWWLTSTHGVIAAAWLWVGRMAFDTLLMFWLCARVQATPTALQLSPAAALAACLVTAAFAASLLDASTLWRSAIWAVAITLTALLLKPWRQPDAPLDPCLSNA